MDSVNTAPPDGSMPKCLRLESARALAEKPPVHGSSDAVGEVPTVAREGACAPQTQTPPKIPRLPSICRRNVKGHRADSCCNLRAALSKNSSVRVGMFYGDFV